MLKQIFSLDALPQVARGAKDNFVVCDMEGFVEACQEMPPRWSNEIGGSWYGGMDYARTMACVKQGDLAGVVPSETFMAAMEGHVFVSKGWRVVDDVVGSFPNIPALLAGVPTNMRRRVRVAKQTAPLSIFVDLTSSAMISATMLVKRGAAMLALVRLLANVRPVELWVFTGIGGHKRANYTAVRLDTSPLDLARAAHMLTHTSVARGLGYKLSHAHHGYESGWPYGNVDTCRKHGPAIMGRVINPGSEVLYIPAIHSTDKSITEPVQWLTDMLAKHGGTPVEHD